MAIAFGLAEYITLKYRPLGGGEERGKKEEGKERKEDGRGEREEGKGWIKDSRKTLEKVRKKVSKIIFWEVLGILGEYPGIIFDHK